MKLQKLPFTAIAIGISFLAGVYQIFQTCHIFINAPIGTEVSEIQNMTEYFNKLMFLYCYADWINMTALENMGLNMHHAYFIAHWLEILTGMFNEPAVYQFNPDLKDNLMKVNSKRTLFYLQEMGKTNKTREKSTVYWIDRFGVPEGKSRIEDSNVWYFEEPYYKSYDARIRFGNIDNWDLSRDVLEFVKQHGNNLETFLSYITGRGAIDRSLTNNIVYRYGMACEKFPASTTQISSTFKFHRDFHSEFISLPPESSPTLIEKRSILQSGVHISAYVGGLPPMIGGDDYSQYRSETLFTCFTGGSVALAKKDNVWSKRLLQAKGLQCVSHCVDPGSTYQDKLKKVHKAFLGRSYQTVLPDNFSYSACEEHKEIINEWKKREKARKVAPRFPLGLHFRFGRKKRDTKEQKWFLFGQLTQQDVLSMKLERTRRLSVKTKPCVKHIPEMTNQQHPFYYSKLRCRFMCLDKLIFQTYGKCTISTLLYSTDITLPPCTPGQFWEAKDRLKSSKASNDLNLCQSNCDQLVPCDSIRVKFTGLEPMLDSPSRKGGNEESQGANHSIRIIPDRIIFHEEYEILPWQTFIANVGGLLGMFCGFSLIGAILWVYKLSKTIRKPPGAKKGRINYVALESIRAGTRLLFNADSAMGRNTESGGDDFEKQTALDLERTQIS